MTITIHYYNVRFACWDEDRDRLIKRAAKEIGADYEVDCPDDGIDLRVWVGRRFDFEAFNLISRFPLWTVSKVSETVGNNGLVLGCETEELVCLENSWRLDRFSSDRARRFWRLWRGSRWVMENVYGLE